MIDCHAPEFCTPPLNNIWNKKFCQYSFTWLFVCFTPLHKLLSSKKKFYLFIFSFNPSQINSQHELICYKSSAFAWLLSFLLKVLCKHDKAHSTWFYKRVRANTKMHPGMGMHHELVFICLYVDSLSPPLGLVCEAAIWAKCFCAKHVKLTMLIW